MIGELYYWTDTVVIYGMLALRIWALIDCLSRKPAAFTAVDKLTKPIWVAILAIGGFLGYYLSLIQAVGIVPLITTITAAVYLADVRPAVREISGGR